MQSGILAETTELAVTPALWRKLHDAAMQVLLNESVEIMDKWELSKDLIWTENQTIDVVRQMTFTAGSVMVGIEGANYNTGKYHLKVADPKANMLKLKELLCELPDLANVTPKVWEADYVYFNKVPTSKQLLADFVGVDPFQYTMRLVESKV
jgi:hypothetical protein